MELGAVSENHFSPLSPSGNLRKRQREGGEGEKGGRLKIERMNYDARNKLAN